MGLTPEQQNELALMTADSIDARHPYVAGGELWAGLCKLLRGWMDTQGIGNVEAQQYNSYFACYPPSHRNWAQYAANLTRSGFPNALGRTWYERSVELLYEKLRDVDTHKILDKTHASATSESPMCVVVDGHNMSWDYLTSISAIIAMAEVTPEILESPRVVVDLGAGWGRVGHILRQVNSHVTYVDCDLPETLMIAQAYLPTTLPGIPVHKYSETRTIKSFDRDILSDGGLWFCTPQQLDVFKDDCVDVFVNIASFQEMTMSQVVAYFQIIDRVTLGIFYNQQRCGKMVVMTRDTYPYLSTWKREVSRVTPPLPHLFEDVLRVG